MPLNKAASMLVLRGYRWFNILDILPVICFWVSVESVSFKSCKALAIPPQCWTSSLLL